MLPVYHCSILTNYHLISSLYPNFEYGTALSVTNVLGPEMEGLKQSFEEFRGQDPRNMDPEETLNRIRTAGGVSMSAELFEKLYLSPQNEVKGNLRKTFGNPTPMCVAHDSPETQCQYNKADPLHEVP